VTEEVVVTAIVELGLRTVREVRTATGAGGGCTCCHRELRELLLAHAPSDTASRRLVSVPGVSDSARL
jgi:bacterioferritin-associated ferredoxin